MIDSVECIRYGACPASRDRDWKSRPHILLTQATPSVNYSLAPPMREQERRVWFANLPDTATIRIYSLDGDLIREIEHPDKHLTRYSSVVGWDLISRNTQAITSGIYIWRVDSRLGSQVGKIVIIK